MRTRPILFNGEMVRAILDGRKTQTRRVIRPQPKAVTETGLGTPYPPGILQWSEGRKLVTGPVMGMVAICPWGAPGDQLYVRETWGAHPFHNSTKPSELDPAATNIYYRATYKNESHVVWRPSIHMPRWASRITLEVEGVRVERVQGISEKDCLAEGICQFVNRLGTFYTVELLYKTVQTGPDEKYGPSAQRCFQSLWDSIYAKRHLGWQVNPWVWVIEFRRAT